MREKIEQLKIQLKNELEAVENLQELDAIRVKYLGKKGLVTDLLKGMKDLSNDERKAVGALVNELNSDKWNTSITLLIEYTYLIFISGFANKVPESHENAFSPVFTGNTPVNFCQYKIVLCGNHQRRFTGSCNQQQKQFVTQTLLPQ